MAYKSMTWFICFISFIPLLSFVFCHLEASKGNMLFTSGSLPMLSSICHSPCILHLVFPSDFRAQPSCPYRINCWEQLKSFPVSQWFNQYYLLNHICIYCNWYLPGSTWELDSLGAGGLSDPPQPSDQFSTTYSHDLLLLLSSTDFNCNLVTVYFVVNFWTSPLENTNLLPMGPAQFIA